jgi:hypothetical protein
MKYDFLKKMMKYNFFLHLKLFPFTLKLSASTGGTGETWEKAD